MWFIGVEVEQETSAPPPKKNPGSAPECTLERQFNEVPICKRDWKNLFVISRIRYIENLDLTNFWENKQNVR